MPAICRDVDGPRDQQREQRKTERGWHLIPGEALSLPPEDKCIHLPIITILIPIILTPNNQMESGKLALMNLFEGQK